MLGQYLPQPRRKPVRITHSRLGWCLAHLSATERASILQLIPEHSTLLGTLVSAMYLQHGRMRKSIMEVVTLPIEMTGIWLLRFYAAMEYIANTA